MAEDTKMTIATEEAIVELQLKTNEALLTAASAGDLPTIKTLLTSGLASSSSSSSASSEPILAQPWYESPTMLNWSALHFATENGHTAVVRYLLANGAIWNAVDVNGFTAGDVAWSANWTQCYAALLEEGVRQGLLGALLEKKAGGEESDEEEDDDGEEAGTSTAQVDPATNTLTLSAPADGGEVVNDNEAFLKSPLRFVNDPNDPRRARCMDQDDNMVMAGWETEIMRRSAERLCEGLPKRRVVKDEDGEERIEGFKVLNVGYGLGIIDDFLQSHSPALHVIIEPHPDVVKYLRTSHPELASAPGVVIIEKTWEAALEDSQLWELAPEGFDAIYADPFAQDYKDLKVFFDRLPDLLRGGDETEPPSQRARFGFFHGLAATNRFLYDVYTRLVELDLRDIGLETEWETVKVDMDDAEEVWEGVRRKYWTLDEYRLPTCRMGVI